MPKSAPVTVHRAYIVTLLAAVLFATLPLVAGDAVPKREVITAETNISVGVGETTDRVMIIGGAEVRIKLIDGKAYIAVAKGTLEMNYADGTPMTSLKAGGVMSLSGFLGGGSGVTVKIVNGKPVLTLAPVQDLIFSVNRGAGAMSINNPGGKPNPRTLAAPTPIPAKYLQNPTRYKKILDIYNNQKRSSSVKGPSVFVKRGETMPTLKPGQVARFYGSSAVAFNSQGNTYFAGRLKTNDGTYYNNKLTGKVQIQNGGLMVKGNTVTLTGSNATVSSPTGVVRFAPKGGGYGSTQTLSNTTSKINTRNTKSPYSPNTVFGVLNAWNVNGASRDEISP